MNTKNDKTWIAAVILAITASLCCITPLLALLAGISGISAMFSWLEPARPLFIGSTVIILGFGWYQKLKPRKKQEIGCACEENEKPSFWQSKAFLSFVTIVAIGLLAFPSYSRIFYRSNRSQVSGIKDLSVMLARFSITGMTCASCEEHVKNAVKGLDGVLEASANYEDGTVKVEFNDAKISIEQIVEAINFTGYKIEGYEIQPSTRSSNAFDNVYSFQEAAVNKIELEIQGMTCSGCEGYVKHAVNQLEGVIGASASFKDGKAVITYDASKTSPAKIKEAIDRTGFKVVETN